MHAESVCEKLLSPRWGLLVSAFPHGLRRGLHSYAATRLKPSRCVGRVADPALHELHTSFEKHYAWRSRRISAESTKNPIPMLSGMIPNAAAVHASDSTRAISANVIM